jgi:hypothetical protein
MNETITHRDESPLFSERFKMAHAAYQWCRDNHASVSAPENIVTALFSLGLVVKPPALTDAELTAIKTAIVYLKEDDDFPGIAEDKATLLALLERTERRS